MCARCLRATTRSCSACAMLRAQQAAQAAAVSQQQQQQQQQLLQQQLLRQNQVMTLLHAVVHCHSPHAIGSGDQSCCCIQPGVLYHRSGLQ